MALFQAITVGLKRVSDTVKAFYVRDSSGTERKVYDTDGKLYQVGTVITATATELNKLASAGDVVASGTTAANIADAKVNYTTGDLDTEAELIAAFNTTNGKINALIAALEAFKISSAT